MAKLAFHKDLKSTVKLRSCIRLDYSEGSKVRAAAQGRRPHRVHQGALISTERRAGQEKEKPAHGVQGTKRQAPGEEATQESG